MRERAGQSPIWVFSEAMAPHRAAWADLATRALEPNIFNDPAFALTAAFHLSGPRRPRFLLAWDPLAPERLIGLCCVAPATLPLPRSAWLHPQATAAFPLLDQERAAVALAALLGRTGLLMHGLPADGPTMRLLADDPRWSIVQVASRSRAVVRNTPPSLVGKAGKELRRQSRRMAETGQVAVTVTAAPEGLDAFLRLERQGWKGRSRTALADTPRLARFVCDMTTALGREGRCLIHSLTLDDRPVAMGLVLRSGPHAFFWKTAFDEAYARFSPGTQLAQAIGQAQAFEPGLCLTDSCAVPGHSMIDRVWPDRMTVADAFVVPAPRLSVAHRMVLASERARRTAKTWIKRAATIRFAVRGAPGHTANMSGP